MADWRLDQRTEETPVESDITILSRGTSTFKTTFKKIKDFIIGTTTLTTTDTTVTGAIEEVKGIADNNTTQLNDFTKLSTLSLNEAQAIASNTETTLLLNNLVSENNKHLVSVENGNIKILEEGIYLLEYSFATSSANVTGYLQTRIYKNSSNIIDVNRVQTINSTTNSHIKGFCIGKLSENDILNLKLFHTHSSSFNIITDSMYNHLKIKKVG